MTVAILLSQAGKAAGVAGFAREDFDTGTAVGLSYTGGPFASQLWTIGDKPINYNVPAQSGAVIAAPTSATTQVTPVDYPGTYQIKLAVDAGFGLGARAEDNAQITFYAGPPGVPLNTQWDALPRRIPAFGEKTEHNVKSDPVFPTGNPRGWAQEMDRWFGVITRVYSAVAVFGTLVPKAWGRIAVAPGGPATLIAGYNVGTPTWTAQGKVTVPFQVALADALYAVNPTARGATGGSCTVNTELVGSFKIERANFAGVLTDADFSFVVWR